VSEQTGHHGQNALIAASEAINASILESICVQNNTLLTNGPNEGLTVAGLICHLVAILKTKGNLRCVTPGFDESAPDDLATVKVVRLRFRDDAPGGHCGRHEYADDGEPAVLINF
jgi:hypothetical protein